MTKSIVGSVLVPLAVVIACASDEPASFRSLEAVCIEDQAEAEADVWLCPETLEVVCGEDEVPEEIFVVLGTGECEATPLAVAPGPFGPGTHPIVVTADGSDDVVCETELVIVDPEPPVVETLTLSMWPPNHKMHAFEVTDCFEEVIDCDPDWTARLLWAASDEPENAQGDGNTSPDIVFESETGVSLRSERAGGSNGRVYTLGWVVEDSSGNATEGVCFVNVDHDRSGDTAVDDGEAYRLDNE